MSDDNQSTEPLEEMESEHRTDSNSTHEPEKKRDKRRKEVLVKEVSPDPEKLHYLDIFNLSDTELVLLSIKSSVAESLPVDSIYNYIETFFPERAWRNDKSSYKNSIRHAIAKGGNIFCSRKTLIDRGTRHAKVYYINPDFNDKIDAELRKGISLLLALRKTRKNRSNMAEIVKHSKIEASPYYVKTNVSIKQEETVFDAPTVKLKRPSSYDTRKGTRYAVNKKCEDPSGDPPLSPVTERIIRKAWNEDNEEERSQKASYSSNQPTAGSTESQSLNPTQQSSKTGDSSLFPVRVLRNSQDPESASTSTSLQRPPIGLIPTRYVQRSIYSSHKVLSPSTFPPVKSTAPIQDFLTTKLNTPSQSLYITNPQRLTSTPTTSTSERQQQLILAQRPGTPGSAIRYTARPTHMPNSNIVPILMPVRASQSTKSLSRSAITNDVMDAPPTTSDHSYGSPSTSKSSVPSNQSTRDRSVFNAESNNRRHNAVQSTLRRIPPMQPLHKTLFPVPLKRVPNFPKSSHPHAIFPARTQTYPNRTKPYTDLRGATRLQKPPCRPSSSVQSPLDTFPRSTPTLSSVSSSSTPFLSMKEEQEKCESVSHPMKEEPPTSTATTADTIPSKHVEDIAMDTREKEESLASIPTAPSIFSHTPPQAPPTEGTYDPLSTSNKEEVMLERREEPKSPLAQTHVLPTYLSNATPVVPPTQPIFPSVSFRDEHIDPSALEEGSQMETTEEMSAIENSSTELADESLLLDSTDDFPFDGSDFPLSDDIIEELLKTPIETSAMEDIEEDISADISSMNFTDNGEEQSRNTTIPIEEKELKEVENTANPAVNPELRKEDNTKESGGTLVLGSYTWRPAPKSVPDPTAPPPFTIELDKPKNYVVKAVHTSLPAPIVKKKEVEAIKLLAPPKIPIRQPRETDQSKLSLANLKVDKRPKSILVKKNDGDRKNVEGPRSRVALSLMAQKSGVTEGISRRRVQKEEYRVRAMREMTPPPDITNEEEDEPIDIIFEGASTKKRIKFICHDIQFGDRIGFPAENSEDSREKVEWNGSLADYMIKSTEKERETERQEREEEEKKRDERNTEIARLKKGRRTKYLKKLEKKNKLQSFDPLRDRWIETREDGEKRRQREDFKEFMDRRPEFYYEEDTPFFLHRCIDGILRGHDHSRENQRIIFARVNPNPNLPHIVSGGPNRSIYIHSYTDGSIVNTHRPHFTYPTDAAWSYCGRYIIACGTDKLVTIINPDTYPSVHTRFYSDGTPVGVRFSQDRNIAFVALESGGIDVFDVRQGKDVIVNRFGGLPTITCIDTNPLNWSQLAIGCDNGLVAEYDFFEDHRKSCRDSFYFQYNIPGLREPIFNILPMGEYPAQESSNSQSAIISPYLNARDGSGVKSIRYCSSTESDCQHDIVLTKGDRNKERGDSAYKFSPGRDNPPVVYSPPEGFNISTATFAFNYNVRHQERYKSSVNYVVAATEEGTVVTFHADSGDLLEGGTAVIGDHSTLGNDELRYLKDVDDVARFSTYNPVKKYFSHEKVTFDPNLATRITAIDSVPDHYMGAFVVGGWGINPTLNIYRFHDDSDIEHLLNL